MLKTNIIFYFLLISGFFACTSGKKAFHSGNYERAIYLSVDRLRKSPDHTKSRQTLGKAYKLYLDKSTSDARNLKSGVDVFRWDNVVNVYNHVHQVYDQIKTCPAALEVVSNPARFDEPLEDARKNASNAHYEAGVTHLSGGTREKARLAYQHFKIAQEFFPNLKSDCVALMNEAKQKATLQVVVLLMPINSAYNLQKYALSDVILRNALNQYVQELEKREFLDAEIIQEPNGELNNDDLLKLAYTDYVPEKSQMKEDVVQRLDSVRKEENRNGQTFVSYEKVWIELGVKEKSVRSTATLEAIITDAETGQILFNESIQASYSWQSKWAVVRTGDIRAASPEHRILLEKSEEIIPNHQRLIDELQKSIANQIKEKINNYYKAY